MTSTPDDSRDPLPSPPDGQSAQQASAAAPPPPSGGNAYGVPPSSGGPQASGSMTPPPRTEVKLGDAFSSAMQAYSTNSAAFLMLGGLLLAVWALPAVAIFATFILPIFAFGSPDMGLGLTATLPVGVMLSILGMVVGYFAIQIAVVKASQVVYEGKKLTLGSAFSNVPWIQCLLASIIMGIVFFVVSLISFGLGTLLVPPFFVFIIQAIIHGDSSSIGSIGKNFSLLIKHPIDTILIAVLGGAINSIATAVCLFPYALFSLPFITLATTFLYREFTGRSNNITT